MPALKKQVSAWVWRLSALTRFPADQASSRAQMLDDVAEGLSRAGIPPSMFSRESLLAIADKNEWFPAYKSLKFQIEEYWHREIHQFSDPEIPNELISNFSQMTNEEKAWIQIFLRDKAVGWRRDGEKIVSDKEAKRRRSFTLQLMTQNSPRAADVIVRKLGIE